MAKPTKPKKSRIPSLHSRASRRRSLSPSLNLDKSLKSVPRLDSEIPDKTTTKQLMEKTLHEISLRNNGISKKNKKKLSTKQRRRKEINMEKALIAAERLEKKVEGSKKKGKVVQGRKGEWEELNGSIEVPTEEGVDILKRKGTGTGTGLGIGIGIGIRSEMGKVTALSNMDVHVDANIGVAAIEQAIPVKLQLQPQTSDEDIL